MAKTTAARSKGSGKRRHYRGKTVNPDGSPRAHTHGGHSPARSGWTLGDTAIKAVATKTAVLGVFKVNGPTKARDRSGIIRNATTGEAIN